MGYHDMMIHNKIRLEHRLETLGKYFFVTYSMTVVTKKILADFDVN